MKVLAFLYIVGVICGIMGTLIVRLEIASHMKEKKRQGVINKIGWERSVVGVLKTIVQILTPVYHYLVLVGAMNTPREELINEADKVIGRQVGGDKE